jgi:hypothetical protein
MRTIAREQRTDIDEALNGNLLGCLGPAMLEKDIHVTDALAALASIRVSHTAYRKDRRSQRDTRPAEVTVETRMIFAGGTCLAKAHGLIERMSEDIDIKVVLDEVPEGYALAGGRGDRSRLGELHVQVCERLKGLGFTLIDAGDVENPRSRDNRRYFLLHLAFRAEFGGSEFALRPELKIELIHRPPMLPVEPREMGYLLDQLVGRASAAPFSMPCISVAETLGEKILSLLRRCAWNWDGRQRGSFDAALVRHIYDTWRICAISPDSVDEASVVFEALVMKDVAEFGAQHEEFADEPFGTLHRALNRTATELTLRHHFNERLIPLVFAAERPVYDNCLASFTAAAHRMLRAQSKARSRPRSTPRPRPRRAMSLPATRIAGNRSVGCAISSCEATISSS